MAEFETTTTATTGGRTSSPNREQTKQVLGCFGLPIDFKSQQQQQQNWCICCTQLSRELTQVRFTNQSGGNLVKFSVSPPKFRSQIRAGPRLSKTPTAEPRKEAYAAAENQKPWSEKSGLADRRTEVRAPTPESRLPTPESRVPTPEAPWPWADQGGRPAAALPDVICADAPHNFAVNKKMWENFSSKILFRHFVVNLTLNLAFFFHAADRR